MTTLSPRGAVVESSRRDALTARGGIGADFSQLSNFAQTAIAGETQ